MDDTELDRLYEGLILDPTYVSATSPPEYVRGRLWNSWWGARTGTDIAYYNSDRKLHRIYGPAYISTVYKFEAWYKDGELHRDGGPALISTSNEYWFLNGVPHRLDGPAISGNGRKKEYWINGQQLSPKNYKLEIERRKRKGLIKCFPKN